VGKTNCKFPAHLVLLGGWYLLEIKPAALKKTPNPQKIGPNIPGNMGRKPGIKINAMNPISVTLTVIKLIQ